MDWYSCRSHKFQISCHLSRRVCLRNGDHAGTNQSATLKTNTKHTDTDKQADNLAALYSSSWQQCFSCTAGMKSCCSHANIVHSHPAKPNLSPSWWKQSQRVCLGIRIFPTWMQTGDAVKKSEQKKTGSVYAMVRTVRTSEWNAQAEWNNVWQITIWQAAWLNKERTEPFCIITRTGNSKHY